MSKKFWEVTDLRSKRGAEVQEKNLQVSPTPDAGIDRTSRTGSSLATNILRHEPPRRGAMAVMAAYHQAPALYRVVNPIAHRLASLDLWIDTTDEKNIREHPFLDLMGQPNHQMSGYQYRKLQALYMILLGETFDLVVPSDNTAGFELLPIPPYAVTLVVDDGETFWEVVLNNQRQRFQYEDVIWQREANLINPYDRGSGVGKLLSDELELDEYLSKHLKSTFYNNAMPSQIVHIKGAKEDQIKALKQKWMSLFQGPDKKGIPLFSSDGEEDININTVSEPMKDLGAIDFRRFSFDVVREALNVPEPIVGELENANKASSYVADLHFNKNCIDPRAKHLKSEWDMHLTTRFEDDFEVGIENPIPEDKQEKLEAYAAEPRTVTVNEWRKAQGLPPREDGDIYLRDPFIANVPAAPIEDKSSDEDVLFVLTTEEPVKKAIDEEDLRTLQATVELTDEEHDSLMQAYENIAVDFAAQQMSAMGAPNTTEALEAIRPGITDHINDEVGDLINGIDDTTKSRVKDLTQQMLEKGKNPSWLERQLRNDFGNRAKAIARTESLRAASVGKQKAMEQSKVVSHKKWIAKIDGETRPNHRELNGKTVPVDEAWDAGSWEPKYPGDGPADETINCRCAAVSVVDPDKSFSPDEQKAILKEWDKALTERELTYKETLDKVFEGVRERLFAKIQDLAV